jgi:hypothetical protein
MTTLTTSLEIAKLALAHCGVSKAITAIDADASVEDRMCNLFYAPTRDELIELYPWHHAIEHRPLVLQSGYAEYNTEYSKTADTISNITQADPAVVTTAADNLVTGDYAKIYDVSGMTEVNRSEPYHLTRTGANALQLTGIDSSSWTAYTSGGSIVKLEPLAKYSTGNVYELPSNYAYAVGIEGDYDFELKGIDGDLKLLTVADDAILIYIKNDTTDVSKWKSTFINALALRLAINIQPTMKGLGEAGLTLEQMFQRYTVAENEAKLLYSMDKQQTKSRHDPWITARGGHGKRGGYWVNGQFIWTSSSENRD